MFQYLKQSRPHVVLLQETHLHGNRVLALRRPWIQRAFHVIYCIPHSQGEYLSLLVKRFPVLSTRCSRIRGDDMWQWSWTFATISCCWWIYTYLPHLLLYDLFVKLAPHAQLPLLLMRDFNATLDALDSSNPGRMGSVELLPWASVTGLNELWWYKNPTDRCYSHLSQSHRSSARIDLAFGNSALLPYLQGIKYLAGGISDHNPLSLSLAFPMGKRSRSWKLSPGWLQNDRVASHMLESSTA